MNLDSPRVTPGEPAAHGRAWLREARRRGVLRVATSYAVIAWLVIQIGATTFDPLGLPRWVLTTLIVTAALGFPVALLLAWFLELTPKGLERDTAGPAAPRPAVQGLRRYADLFVIAALLGVIAVLLTNPGLLPGTRDEQGAAVIQSSLAVVPFDEVGGTDNAYLSEGLADELRDQLARVPDLRVAARSSSMLVRRAPLDAAAIAQKLGVAAVVEGSIRRERERIRVSVQLVNGRDGLVLWSQRYDRELDDLLRIQEDIATAVVGSMVPAFVARGGSTPMLPTRNAAAHESYLLGRHFMRRAQLDDRKESLEQAVIYLRKSVAVDPRNALASAALAEMLLNLRFVVPAAEGAKLLEEAEPLVERSLALDPSLPEAHRVKGLLLRWTNRPGGLDEYRRAYELNPSNVDVHDGYAAYLYREMRFDDITALRRRGVELDPLSPIRYVRLGTALVYDGPEGREEAVGIARRLHERLGDTPEVRSAAAEIFAEAGALDEAIASRLKALENDAEGRDAHLLFVAEALADMGETDGAVQILKSLAGRDSVAIAYRIARARDDVEETVRTGTRLHEREPRNRSLRHQLAAANARNGDAARAVRLLREDGYPQIALDPEHRSGQASVAGLSIMITALGVNGETDEARRLAQWLQDYEQKVEARGALIFWDCIAGAVAARWLDEPDEALRMIQLAAEHPAALDTRIEHNPSFASLRSDPRFRASIELMRARQGELRRRLPDTLKRYEVALPAQL